MHGEAKQFYKNGKVKFSGHYKNDEPDGEGKYYDQQGKLLD